MRYPLDPSSSCPRQFSIHITTWIHGLDIIAIAILSIEGVSSALLRPTLDSDDECGNHEKDIESNSNRSMLLCRIIVGICSRR